MADDSGQRSEPADDDGVTVFPSDRIEQPTPTSQPGAPEDDPDESATVLDLPAAPTGFTQDASGYGYVSHNAGAQNYGPPPSPYAPSPGFGSEQGYSQQDHQKEWGGQSYGRSAPHSQAPHSQAPHGQDSGYQHPGFQQPGYQQFGHDQNSAGYGYQQSQPPRSRRTAWIAGSAVLAMILGGGVAYALAHRDEAAPCRAAAGCTPPVPVPTTGAAAGPTPTRVTVPGEALALSAVEAETELRRQSDENEGAAEDLEGRWVSQVSSKCVGVTADIDPSFVPDGVIDTTSITVQEILAFNLSVSQRFGALTVQQTDLGIDQDEGKKGICSGQVIWMSIVPKGYSSAEQANAWCDANVPPIKECLARYVARPGETSMLKGRTG